MYRSEVPLYGQLVDIVNSVDSSILAARGQGLDDLPVRHQLERHGAIRVGTAQEMRMISRLFGIMGMHPVGYYDLEVVGYASLAPLFRLSVSDEVELTCVTGRFPLHGTAFRPRAEESLRNNPFRVFTTVLRPDLISSPSVRKTAMDVLSGRTLFSPRLCQLMDAAEQNRSSLTADDADELIAEALKIFKWHSRSTVPLETYLSLKHEHPMVADIVCFPSAHINHLTPRTLDIDAVQAEMIAQGLPAKTCIEGPPGGRKCEILLRQTSFKALEERVAFSDHDGSPSGKNGTHTARFGEVEQRGAAVTRKGRELYDRLLNTAIALAERRGCEVSEVLVEVFGEFPDDWVELRRQGLVYFRYRVVPGAAQEKLDVVLLLKAPICMEQLLEEGVVGCEPITYEDFLPLSAAGIFTSNLGGESSRSDGNGTEERKLQHVKNSSREELERILGCNILSEMDLYEDLQSTSVRQCAAALGLNDVLLG